MGRERASVTPVPATRGGGATGAGRPPPAAPKRWTAGRWRGRLPGRPGDRHTGTAVPPRNLKATRGRSRRAGPRCGVRGVAGDVRLQP